MGRLSIAEATRRLTDTNISVVEVTPSAEVSLSSVIGGIGDESSEDAIGDPFAPRPGIDRREDETSARILTSDYFGSEWLHLLSCA